MKQLLFIFSFMLLAGMTANAQACSKSASAGKSCCAAKKTASTSSAATDTKVASFVMEADAAMSANENISKKTCAESGKTTYYEKSVCQHSGKVSYDEVIYDPSAKTFTKVASASMEKDENGAAVETKSCSKKEGKACCSKKEAKACCAKKDGAKACAGKEKESSK